MLAIVHGRSTSVFQQRYAVNVMQNNCVCHTIRVDGRGSLYRHHIARIVVVMVAEYFVRYAAVWFINAAQRINRTHSLIHPR